MKNMNLTEAPTLDKDTRETFMETAKVNNVLFLVRKYRDAHELAKMRGDVEETDLTRYWRRLIIQKLK